MESLGFEKKFVMTWQEELGRAILAGMCIALGATLMLVCKAEGLPGIVCGMAFSMGLWLVSCVGGDLFTGNCLMLSRIWYGVEIHLMDGDEEVFNMEGPAAPKIVRTLAVSYLGNFVGALLAAILVSASGMSLPASEVADAKMALQDPEILVRGLLCNVCVCLAVYIASNADGVSQRLVACMLPVACFVACGWEHSVADMFLLPLGGVYGVEFAAFLAKVTLGNIVGGWLLSAALDSQTEIGLITHR